MRAVARQSIEPGGARTSPDKSPAAGDGELIFYHAPQTRSAVIHWLLEELGVSYRIEPVDIRDPAGAGEAYRAIQSHGKVPAIRHNGVTVTERAAIAQYLTEVFPEAGLAPAVGTPERAAYLSWLVYSDAVMDPVMSAHYYAWEYQTATVSFGRYEDMVSHVERTLAAREYVAGARFTAADVLFGGMLYWLVEVFHGIEKTPAVEAYLHRLTSRQAFQRAIIGASALDG